jgi:hypothetical protein
MKKSKALNIINLIDESRYAHWKLAVDENCLKLKPALEKLGFKVISFQNGLPDNEVNKLLIKEKVNFFLTLDCDDFFTFLRKTPRPNYSILCLSQSVLANVQQTAKAIEGAIMYDLQLDGVARFLDINGQYITNLPKLKKQNKINQKK